ncbi:MAG TPA: hypothetical protein VFQ61_10060 [Polyangiaceae bacterium]|nr:hypothetical protein [Polyangiaceae bacterium]
MFQPWQCTLHVTSTAATLLLTDPTHDLLKARLNPCPSHPRALLTLLEGLSLWGGDRLRVALSVEEGCLRGLGSTLLGDELWPAESALVQYDVVRPARPKRLDGIGDFRQLRRVARRCGP